MKKVKLAGVNTALKQQKEMALTELLIRFYQEVDENIHEMVETKRIKCTVKNEINIEINVKKHLVNALTLRYTCAVDSINGAENMEELQQVKEKLGISSNDLYDFAKEKAGE